MTDPTTNPPADNADDQRDSEQAQQIPLAKAPDSRGKNSSDSNNGLAVFSTLLALLALLGVALTWYQTQVKQVQSKSSLAVGITEIGGQVSRLGDSIARLQTQQDGVVTVDQLDNRLTQINTQVSASLDSIGARQQELRNSIDKINTDLQAGVGAYLFEEVSQLLKLANHNAVFANDKSMAITALQLADGQLKQLSDPRYAAVRRKINEELMELENAQQADITALSATLNGIARAVPELPLFNEPPAQEIQQQQAEPATESNWRTALGEVWRDISGLIKIQRVEQVPVPLLAPEQRYFLNQNLQLYLNKSELALLQRNNAVYQQSLESAVGWIEQYFDLDDSQVQGVLTQLQELREQQPGGSLPDITGSYDLLQRVQGR